MKKIFAVTIFVFTLCAFATSAFAHAHIEPDTAAKGSSGTFVLTLPNERSDADTTEIALVFDEDNPIGDAAVTTFDDWKSNAEYLSDGEVLQKITLTGGRITGENSASFDIELKDLPGKGDSFTIKVLQTYSDGQVVRWIDEPEADGAEPDHPALSISLFGADVTDSDASKAADDEIMQTTVKNEKAEPKKSENSKAPIYIIIAVAAVFVVFLGAKFYRNTK